MKKLFFLAAVALMMATGCNNQNNKTTQVTTEPEPVVEQTSGIYDITVKDMDGSDVSLANYKGKVLLIVNVASKCGLTPQYQGLEALYQKYHEQGLEILGFPCNQFLGQEPGTNEEIQSFCSLNYNVTFPLFAKIDVNGESESPLYTYLKEQAPFKGYPEGAEEFAAQLDEIHQKTGTGFDQGDAIRWNFGKFLVSKDGKTILRFEPMVTPDMMEGAVQELLGRE
ncbi:MAG: glutathione peroxidase [Bacteroidales bacterium]|nr:glutathione peroxidase [Bacteroidales bacterium]MBQ6729359.1 glutathione peroxidase [Bacteroidales bacterium]